MFAISGALVASRKQMDIVGFVLLGTVTGIGGGTLRDVLLGANPVFWINEPAYLVACVAVSSIVFFTAHIPQSRYQFLLWFDALGLGIFAVVGAETFVSRATSSNGSPRNNRATTANLRLTEKRFGPFPSTSEGAPAPALGERSGAPSGLRPSSFVMSDTPVEVQFTSAGCLNYPCRTPDNAVNIGAR